MGFPEFGFARNPDLHRFGRFQDLLMPAVRLGGIVPADHILLYLHELMDTNQSSRVLAAAPSLLHRLTRMERVDDDFGRTCEMEVILRKMVDLVFPHWKVSSAIERR